MAIKENTYSIFVRNGEGGIFEFYDLSKMEALDIVRKMKDDGFTEVDMVQTFKTPYHTDSIQSEEFKDDDGEY